MIAADLEEQGRPLTLVFLHKPLWTDTERRFPPSGDDTPTGNRSAVLGRPAAHRVLRPRITTLSTTARHDTILATTGGSSPIRAAYGEFDHAWLTMEKDGPHVANLLLDGIQPGDVVSEQSIGRFREFLAKTQLEVAPILVDDEAGFSQGRIDLRLTNRFDTPVEVSATIAGLPLRGLTIEPETLKLSAAPGKTEELAVTVKFADKIAFAH
jgi:hypothetical protein